MKKAIIILSIFLVSACKDDFSEEKYDVQLGVTNKRTKTISTIKVDGANGAKVWMFEKVKPDETVLA